MFVCGVFTKLTLPTTLLMHTTLDGAASIADLLPGHAMDIMMMSNEQ